MSLRVGAGVGVCDGGATAFSPARLPGALLWLRDEAADITVATGISNWADASGASHPLSQATGGNQPAYNATLVNGRPGGTATAASNQWLNRGDVCGLANGAARTLWCVARIPVAATRTPLMGVGSSASSTETLVLEANTFGTAGTKWGLFAQGTTYDTSGAADTLWHLHVLTVSDMTAGVAKAGVLGYYVDNTLQVLTVKNAGTATWTTQATWNQTSWFAFPGIAVAGSASSVGGGILSGVLGAADRAALRAYAQTRWGTP